MAEGQAKFLSGSLLRHVTVMSLTSTVGLMAVFLVDFIDMVFISMLGKAELAAAIGYAGAILFFTTSFSIGMAIAVGALVARDLGAGDTDRARLRSSHGLAYGIGFGVLFSAFVWWNIPTFVRWIGAEGETAALAEGYLAIIIPSLPFLVVGMMGSGILRAHGDARRAMMATIWGGGVNAVLDPILIFGLGLDLTGAALASVAARVAIATTAILPILRHHGGLPRPEVVGMLRDLGPLVTIGFPAILTQFATPVGQAIVTRSMAQYGLEAVAGMAIVGRLMPVAFAVIFALSGAVGPILGQNFGAGRYDRVRAGFDAALIFAGSVIFVIAWALFILRGPIADLFDASGVTRDLVFLFCGPLALLFFFNGVLFVANAAFNNLGHPFYSTWMNWGRNTVAMIPLVWVGGQLYGAEGVLIGQALSAVVFGALAWLLARRVIAAEGGEVPRDSFAREGRLLSLLNLRK
ncbi:MATE family efflux transporter [Tateyamaria sp. ANG-S1]|uniref:MATE family efflux transporter n=1 Tax=Tateyamaria sp. ANG-S1 TaxID=1577905 RepID=UPI00057C4711|nr:MATE family efflux transporter [Tateyamaria sp. ANG-S1]KIC50104.1 multidrug transporter MatE [Tateyamaria sp. ANG-S1]